MGIPKLAYDGSLIIRDAALRGWNIATLARCADIHHATAYHFVSGRRQTAKTASSLALALGRPVRRYLAAQESKLRKQKKEKAS